MALRSARVGLLKMLRDLPKTNVFPQLGLMEMEVPRPYSLGYILVLYMHDVMAVNARFTVTIF